MLTILSLCDTLKQLINVTEGQADRQRDGENCYCL